MPENRIRLGPFAQKLLAQYADAATPDGKALDEILLKAFADGRALEPVLAQEVRDSLEALPDWEAYQDGLIERVYTGVDGIGNESVEAFAALNKRITTLEESLAIAIRNTVVLSKKLDRLLADETPPESTSDDPVDDPVPF